MSSRATSKSGLQVFFLNLPTRFARADLQVAGEHALPHEEQNRENNKSNYWGFISALVSPRNAIDEVRYARGVEKEGVRKNVSCTMFFVSNSLFSATCIEADSTTGQRRRSFARRSYREFRVCLR